MRLFSKGIIVLGLAGMMFAAGSGGQQKDCDPGYRDGQRNNMMQKGSGHNELFDQIDLSKVQIAKINEIHKESRESHKETQTKLMTARKALVAELDAENSSSAKIAQLKKDILSAQSNMLDEMTSIKMKTKEVLTKDQIKKLKELHEERKDKREEQKAKKTLFNRWFRK